VTSPPQNPTRFPSRSTRKPLVHTHLKAPSQPSTSKHLDNPCPLLPPPPSSSPSMRICRLATVTLRIQRCSLGFALYFHSPMCHSRADVQGASRRGHVGARELHSIRLCWRAPCSSGEPSTHDPFQGMIQGKASPRQMTVSCVACLVKAAWTLTR